MNFEHETEKHKVKAYLSGHVHRYVENTYRNTLMVSGESTSKSFGDSELGFRLWKVSADSLSNTFVNLELIDIHRKLAKYIHDTL